MRVPYTDVNSYYGYAKPGTKPDAVVDGKKFSYIYVWVPAVAPEIGVKMLSPVPEGMAPEKDEAGKYLDFISSTWEANKDEKTKFFDTYITFERSAIINPADIAGKYKSTKWFKLASNDDDSSLPANPSGSNYNSLLRHVSEASDPLKAITRGLYRVGFTTYKRGEVQGSFLAQVGSPVAIPGVVIDSDIKALVAKVNAK